MVRESIDVIGAEELARLITPGLEYLKALEPGLLDANGGSPRYPEDPSALDGMFLNGEVDFNCKFGMFAVATGLAQGTYPEAAEQFVFPEGNMIKNKNYLAIPANAPNPAAALIMTNYMSSVESQTSKLQGTGMPPGIDPWKLSGQAWQQPHPVWLVSPRPIWMPMPHQTPTRRWSMSSKPHGSNISNATAPIRSI